MKNLIYLFVFLGLVTSCSDDPDPSCNVENVVTDLPWLADLLAEEENHFIGQTYSILYTGAYKSKTVFVIGNCCPNCSMAPPAVYDCTGRVLGYMGTDGIEWEDLKDSRIIWRSSNNQCGEA